MATSSLSNDHNSGHDNDCNDVVRMQDDLHSLHRLFTESNSSCGSEVQMLAEDLAFRMDNVNAAASVGQQALATSLLFNKNHGVTAWFTHSRCQNNKEFDGSKILLLTAITKWIRRARNLSMCVRTVRDAARFVFRVEKASNVRINALDLLTALVEQASKSNAERRGISMDQLGLEELAQNCKTTYCSNIKVMSKSVQTALLIFLGHLAEHNPGVMAPHALELHNFYARILDGWQSFVLNKPGKKEFAPQLVAASLEGYTHLLSGFPVEEGTNEGQKIFGYVRLAVLSDLEHLHRYRIPLAGLNLVHRHANLFRAQLCRDAHIIYSHLCACFMHTNIDIKRAGFRALEAFFREVANYVTENVDQRPVFSFFLKQFSETLDSGLDIINMKEISIAVCGFGLFAKPCAKFLPEENVRFMLSVVLQKSEQLFMSLSSNVDDAASHIPSFLNTIANIVRHSPQVKASALQPVERLIVILVEHYPSLRPRQRTLAECAVANVFVSLYSHADAFRAFSDSLIIQLAVVTVARPANDGTVDSLSGCIQYAPFWAALVTRRRGEVDDRTLIEAVKASTYDSLVSAILSIIERLDLETLRDISGCEKSNLSPLTVSGVSTNETSDSVHAVGSDEVVGLRPVTPKDFVIFHNLVAFSRHFFRSIRTDLFIRWVYRFSTKIIECSHRAPLISGFYKLMGICLTICDRHNVFDNIDGKRDQDISDKEHDMLDVDEDITMDNFPESDEDNYDSNDDNYDHISMLENASIVKRTASAAQLHRRSDVIVCFSLFGRYCLEVLERLRQYKDDLLSSCLECVLAIPRQLVEQYLDHGLIKAIQIAFRAGIGYIPLAVLALDALDRWLLYLPDNALYPYIPSLLEALSPFLVVSRDSTQATYEDELVSALAESQSTKRTANEVAVKTSQTTPLMLVRLRIVRLLGRFGGSASDFIVPSILNLGNTNENHVATSPQDMDSSVKSSTHVVWDTEHHLIFGLPLHDIKPDVSLDALLPRIVELAENAADRQLQVSSCELLHAIVVFMIGRAQNTTRSLSTLYRHVFPVILRLSCSSEDVARQLFSTLSMQCVHWFTANLHYESPDTMALLDALINSACDPSDAALRDFGAKCVGEFFSWSVRRNNIKTSLGSGVESHLIRNVKSLFKRLFAYAIHPSPYKRLGSALCFNSLYVAFREEGGTPGSIVDIFLIEVIATYLFSLRLAESDDKALGTVTQIERLLSHLARIARHEAVFLSRPLKSRRRPAVWSINIDDNDSDSVNTRGAPNLAETVEVIFAGIGRLESLWRRQSIALFVLLVPLLSQNNLEITWVKKRNEDIGPCYFVKIFEYPNGLNSSIWPPPNIDGVLTENDMITAVGKWHDGLTAALECYTWFLRKHFLPPSVLFATANEANPSRLLCSLDSFYSGYYDISVVTTLTAAQIAECRCRRCNVLVRSFSLMALLFSGHEPSSNIIDLFNVNSSLLDYRFFNLLADSLFDPSAVGFDTNDPDISTQLPQNVVSTVGVLLKNMPPEQRVLLVDAFTKRIGPEKPFALPGPLLSADSITKFPVRLREISRGHTKLLASGLLWDLLGITSDMACALGNDIIEKVTSIALLGDVAEGSVAAEALCIALEVGVSASSSPALIMEKLLDNDSVHMASSSTRTEVPVSQDQVSPTALITRGRLLLSRMRAPLLRLFATHFTEFAPLLLSQLGHHPIVVDILLGILNLFFSSKTLQAHVSPFIVTFFSHYACMEKWWQFSVAIDSIASEEEILAHQRTVLDVLHKIILLDSRTALSTSSNSQLPTIANMYLRLLNSRAVFASHATSTKIKALELLPYFATQQMARNVLEGGESALEDSISHFMSDHISVNIPTLGSSLYEEYVAILQHLFSALIKSRSFVLFRVIVRRILSRTTLCIPDHVEECLREYARSLVSSTDIAEPLNYCIDQFFTIPKESDRDASARISIISRVLLVLLREIPSHGVTTFFASHVVLITRFLQRDMPPSGVAYSTIHETRAVFLRLLAMTWNVVAVIYNRLGRIDVDKTSKVQANFGAEYGSDIEVSKELIRLSRIAVTCATPSLIFVANEILRKSEEEGWIDLHCAAYSALASVICCTQVKTKVYHAYLFKEKAGETLLWRNIIPSRSIISFVFPIELEFPLAKKEQLTKSRINRRRNDRGSSIRYMSSQYLADSSLSTAVLSFGIDPVEKGATMIIDEKNEPEEEDNESSQEYAEPASRLDLEMDIVNSHVCMLPLLRIMDKIVELDPIPGTTDATCLQPPWMQELHAQMVNSDVAYSESGIVENIRVFIGKLVINRSDYFRPWAKDWAHIITELIMSEIAGSGLTYFAVDLIVMLLDWGPNAIPSRSDLDNTPSRLLHFLVRNAHHSTSQSVINRNLEIIKAVAEAWKDFISVPTQILYDYIVAVPPLASSINAASAADVDAVPSSSTQNRPDPVITGVMLLGLFLASGLSVYNRSSPDLVVDEKTFYEHVVTLVGRKEKKLYSAAAAVVGLALDMFDVGKKVEEFNFLKAIFIKQLASFSTNRENDLLERQLNCLCHAHRHHSAIADNFTNLIFDALPRIYGSMKVSIMKIVLSRCFMTRDLLFRRIPVRDFTSMLRTQDTDVQLIALRLFFEMLPRIDLERVAMVLSTILTTFSKHSKMECRLKVHEICAWLWLNHNYNGSDNEAVDDGTRKLWESLRGGVQHLLLCNLSDVSQHIRDKAFNFWDHDDVLSSDALTRLQMLISQTFDDHLEGQFIHYSSTLLLSLCRRSADFSKPLFSKQLSECRFEQQLIESGWANKNIGFTAPLFSPTIQFNSSILSQASQFPEHTMKASLSTDAGAIGTTQKPYLYQPTQARNSELPFGQSQLATSFSQRKGDTKRMLEHPSLADRMFTSSLATNESANTKSGNFMMSQRPVSIQVGMTFGSYMTPEAGRSDELKSDNSTATFDSLREQQFASLRRRPLKMKSGISSSDRQREYWSKYHLNRQRRRDAFLRESKDSRGQRVSLTRTYRVGEIPDIQIEHSSLIRPLQETVRRDPSLARTLLSLIFKSIYSLSEKGENGNVSAQNATECRSSIAKGLADILAAPISARSPSTVGCVHDMCSVLPVTDAPHPSVIVQSALASGAMYSGVAVVERYLSHHAYFAGKIKSLAIGKRTRVAPETGTAATGDDQSGIWVELSRIYRSLNESDVLTGIFQDDIGAKDLTRRALESELSGDFVNAQRLYAEGLRLDATNDWGNETAPSDAEAALWMREEMLCNRRLLRWDNVAATLDMEVGEDLDALWEEEVREPYLRLFILSHLREGKLKRFDTLTTALDRWLCDSEKRNYLHNQFSADMALAGIARGDMNFARSCVEHIYTDFLKNWSSLHPLMISNRRSRLHMLHRAVEVEEFLDMIENVGKCNNLLEAISNFLVQWDTRKPSARSSLEIWDDVMWARCMLLERIESQLRSRYEDVDGDLNDLPLQISTMYRSQAIWQCDIASAARARSNFVLATHWEEQGYRTTKAALRVLRQRRSNISTSEAEATSVMKSVKSLRLDLTLSMVTTQRTMSQRLSNLGNYDDAANVIVSCLDIVSKAFNNEYDAKINNIDNSPRAALEGALLTDMSTLLHKIHSKGDMLSTNMSTAAKYAIDKFPMSITNTAVAIESPILLYNVVSDIALSQLRVASECENASSTALLQLALFIDDRLKRFSDSSYKNNVISDDSSEDLANLLVLSILRAMAQGDVTAADRFPRLLEVINEYSHTQKTFMEASENIPEWLFLRWISQMVALLDKSHGIAVVPILIRIADVYPQAIFYPFKISSEHFNFGSTDGGGGEVCRDHVEKLARRLKFPLLCRFVDSLSALHHPHMVFSDWYNDFLIPYSSNPLHPCSEKMVSSCRQLCLNIFDSSNQYYGEFYKRFANDWATKVFSIAGKDMSNLLEMSPDVLKKAIQALNDVKNSMNEKYNSSKMRTPGLLKEYSPWLAHFQATNYDMVIEVPGQYHGHSRPLLEYHGTVSSFGDSVLVMDSIRKPKRIMIRTQSELDQPFLVKGGEDLRLDQRIMQLFDIMNGSLQVDPECAERGLGLKTYAVIPMTTRVGIVEWINGSKPLKQIISGTLNDSESKSFTQAQKDYINFWKLGAARSRWATTMKKQSRSDVLQFMQKLHKFLPRAVLKRFLITLASSAEGFFAIRSRFALSLSAISICHYILGIGDRHLSNFLLDLNTGTLIGIDFGHAFHTATSQLPIPEMMPFRLTREFVDVIEPLQPAGLLVTNMTRVMRVLRSQSSVLLATMDVFIKEPTLDWIGAALKNVSNVQKIADSDDKKLIGSSSSEGVLSLAEQQWYPRNKINAAASKLSGHNPVTIFMEEVQTNVSINALGSDVLVAFNDSLMGVPEYNERSRCSQTGLSVEKTVACLIDMATDPNIYGRCWVGWEPFV